MVSLSVFRSHHLPLLLCAPAVLALLGCRGEDPNNPTSLVPVGGSVTVDGSPVAKGVITFAPDVGNPVRVAPTGELDESGKYQLSTSGKTGAPPGKYKACVVLDPGAEESRLKTTPRARPSIPPKYRRPDTTSLVVEVVAQPAAGAYDLKLSAK
ncbi:MAG: hypothetical protein JWO38_8125 [Gemmataceae bacterium]|nr:hypothetical protein [Gemmataceae bacterium]